MPRWAAIAMGLLVGAAAALLTSNPRTPAPTKGPATSQAISEIDGSLAQVWLQYSAEAEPVVGRAQLDFLAGLPPETTSLWTVARGEDSAKLSAFLKRAGAAAARATVVEVPGPLTPWTRDRALALARDGKLLLLVPPDPGESWPERQGDWHAAQWLAAARTGSKSVELPIDFDAGDLILSDEVTLFDANLLAKNRGRGFATMSELAKAVAGWTGRHALGLGENEGDVPRYHMAMYVMPLGQRRALVGDPALARAITGPGWQPGDRSPDDDRALLADDSTGTQARFERAARELRAQGWAVDRVPVVQFDDRTYVTYTNAVVETGSRGRRVYLPQYADDQAEATGPLRRLDAAGQLAWQQAGYTPVPIRVAGVWRHHGTIGCLVNVLWRGAAPTLLR